jgi:integrase
LEDLNFHDLRREATSRLATVFGLHELMKIVGHSSPAMLMRYYHSEAADFAQRLAAAG